MADISFLQNEDLDDANKREMSNSTSEINEGNGDGGNEAENYAYPLAPMARLQQYASCEMSYNRQLVGRILVEIFRSAVDNGTELDVNEVMQPVHKLVHDTDASVRLELAEQLPHVAMICQEAPDRFGNVLSDHLIHIIVNLHHDPEQAVRQSTHAALLALIERGLLDMELVENVVAPSLLIMGKQSSKPELITLAIDGMSKVATLLDPPIAERLLLKRYLSLCSDTNPFIRKLCALHFGEFSAAMSTETIYGQLFPMYVNLCKDPIWSVRKSCADVMVSVACCVSLEYRRTILSQILANHLEDESKWVRLSAYQILGPFISTFAKRFTGFAYNEYGEFVLTDEYGTELRYNMISLAGSAVSSAACKAAGNEEGWGDNDDDNDNENEKENEKENDNENEEEIHQNNSRNRKKYYRGVGKYRLLKSLNDVNKENIYSNESKEQWSISVIETNYDTSTGSDNDTNLPNEDYNMFNPFLYYYIPPDMPLDPDFINTVTKDDDNNSTSTAAETDNKILVNDEKLVNVNNENSNSNDNENDGELISGNDNNADDKQKKRRIVPYKYNSGLSDTCWKISQMNLNEDNSNDNNEEEEEEEEEENKNQTAVITTTAASAEAATTITTSATSDGLQSTTVTITTTTLATSTVVNDSKVINSVGVDNKIYVGNNANIKSNINDDSNDNVINRDNQTIVPQILINFFVSMANLNTWWDLKWSSVEIPRFCAFYFPAVVLTLGKENWSMLKTAYGSLSNAEEYKVRRTMASSIHEIAMILGEELSARDLLPIYDGFIKDLDEVRIGALKHLPTFLKVLKPSDRCQFLPRLSAFLSIDNEWNWRFREELASRLLEAIPLYSTNDVSKHIAPLSFPLLIDKVAAVRQMALQLVTEIICYLSTDEKLIISIIEHLRSLLTEKTSKWTCRQTYAFLCNSLIKKNAILFEKFSHILLPSLLDLSLDTVPNVRLAVIQTLVTKADVLTYILFPDQVDKIFQKIKSLSEDHDRDVSILAISYLKKKNNY